MSDNLFRKVSRQTYQKSPGKFEGSGALGELFHTIMMNGGVDEAIYGGGEGWIGLFRGPWDARVLRKSYPKQYEQLSRDEFNSLRLSKGAIARETSQGFFDVSLYMQKRDMEKDWKKIVAETAGPSCQVCGSTDLEDIHGESHCLECGGIVS